MNQIENILTELKQIRQQLHNLTEILNPAGPNILDKIKEMRDLPYTPDAGLTRMWEELDQKQSIINDTKLKHMLAGLKQK
jgi:hypothetical protein